MYSEEIIQSLTEDNNYLSVSEGSVSSINIFGPFFSGPNDHTDLLYRISQLNSV